MSRRSAALDDLSLAGPVVTDESGRPAAGVWRGCLIVGAVLLYGFATPVRLALSRGLVWAHDWLARHGDPHHRAHHLIVKTRQGGGDWKPGAREIVLAFAATLVLGAAWQLGKRRAAIGQNPLAAFVRPSRRAAVITAVVVLAPPLVVAALLHWQPGAAGHVLRVLTKVTDSLATHTGRDGW